MPIVNVHAPAPDSRYDIHIGHGVLAWVKAHFSPHAGRRAVVVGDSNTAPLYGKTVIDQLVTAGLEASLITLPAGEMTKCPAQLSALYDAFIERRITRADWVLALGGGVIGDLTGYAACTYLRGVHFAQIPTTLLAQVDSSVGGKVAVNHPLGKNLLGAFYQPELVLIDCDTLKTLPPREFGAGLGEVIKYGCIADAPLFDRLEQLGSREALMPQIDEIIARCCEIKARYVQEDPHDHGVRMHLNFGHTLAHAIENGMGYGQVLHGEAVAIGMVQAARWGETLGVTPQGTATRIEALLRAYELETSIPAQLSREAMGKAMALDKKAAGSVIHTVLLTEIGACKTVPMQSGELAALLSR